MTGSRPTPNLGPEWIAAAKRLESHQELRLREFGLLPARVDFLTKDKELTKQKLLAKNVDERRIQAVLSELDRSAAKVSKYELRDHAAILNRAQEQIIEQAAAMDCNMPYPPVIGCLPFGELDSYAIEASGTPYPIVFINEGVLTIGRIAAKIIAYLFRAESRETFSVEWQARLAAEPKIRIAFAEMVIKTIMFGQPELTRNLLDELDPGLKIYNIVHPMIVFLAAHEHAHCILDHHLVRPKTDPRPDITRGDKVVPALWGDEFSADKLAFELTRRVMIADGIPTYLALCGPDLFFTCGRILQRATLLLKALNERNGDETRNALFDKDGPRSNTHPPVIQRYNAIHEVAKATMPSNEFEEAFRFSVALSDVMGELWEATSLGVLTVPDEAAHPVWNTSYVS